MHALRVDWMCQACKLQPICCGPGDLLVVAYAIRVEHEVLIRVSHAPNACWPRSIAESACVSLETSSIIVRWVRSDHRIQCAEFGIVAREPDAFRSRGKWSAACSSWLLVQDGYPAIGSHSCLYCGRHKPDKALSELLFAWLPQAWNPGIVAVTLMMPLLYTAACKRGSCVPVRLGKCYAVAHHSLSVCTGVSCASDPITCRFQKRTAALVGGMHAECSRGSHTVHA
jgi:hypothetical protein